MSRNCSKNNFKRSQANKLEKVHKEKLKTEICKTFVEEGKCQFSEKCSFAHGNNELRDKVQHISYKTKPCKNYHKYGCCTYGTRCQYLHSEIKQQVQWWGYLSKQLNRNEVPYTFPFQKDEQFQVNIRLDVRRFQSVSMTLFENL